MTQAIRAALPAGVLAVALLVGSGAGLAQDGGHREGQDLWRSCSACHCVPDLRIPEDEDWLRLNETTTCISGEKDTPEARKALITYLRAGETIRPLLIDEQHRPPATMTCGKIRVPSTAGSAYLKAERWSVREGTPPKVRLRWKGSENGKTLAVPEGEYRVISYCFYRTDEKERRWSATGTSAEGCTELVISDDEDATFDLLPEIQAHLGCEESEGGHVLGFFMTNRNDKRMSLSRDGRLVNPRWVLLGDNGEELDAGDFEVT